MISGCAPQNTAVAGGSGGVCWSYWCRLLVIRCFSLVWLMPLVRYADAPRQSCLCCSFCKRTEVCRHMQCAACADAVRCDARWSALHMPTQRAAFSGREDSRAWGGMASGLARQSLYLPGVPTTRPHGAVGISALPPRNAGRAVLPFFCKSRGQAHAVAWPGLVGVLRKAEWLPVRGVGVCQSSLR